MALVYRDLRLSRTLRRPLYRPHRRMLNLPQPLHRVLRQPLLLRPSEAEIQLDTQQTGMPRQLLTTFGIQLLDPFPFQQLENLRQSRLNTTVCCCRINADPPWDSAMPRLPAFPPGPKRLLAGTISCQATVVGVLVRSRILRVVCTLISTAGCAAPTACLDIRSCGCGRNQTRWPG